MSTQRPEEQRASARLEDIGFPLLSDAELALTAALRLRTVRVADTVRLRRAVLVIDASRGITAVRDPVVDVGEAVEWSLAQSGCESSAGVRTTGRSLDAGGRPSQP